MRVTLQREDLLKPLGFVTSAVERRHALPILANTLITLRGGVLSLTGTDLEVEVKTTVAVKDGTEGEVTAPARKLFDICRALPAQAKIDLRLEKEKLVLKSGSSRFSLVTMPATEFPGIETTDWQEQATLPQSELKELLVKTHFCMAQQDVRYYLNGLLLEFEDERVRAVATDGHRLAFAEVMLSARASNSRGIIVPRKGIQEVVRFLEDSSEPARISLTSNHIRITLNDLVFTSKLIDGRFPDYTKVIPRNQTKVVRIDREVFRETLNRVAILSNEKYRGIRLGLSKGVMRITAHNPEQEEAQEELSVPYQGEDLEVGFNVNYLSESVSALKSEEAELGLSDSDSSGVLRNPGDEQQLYVVMPMRL